MSSPATHSGPVGPDTLITVKVIIDGQNRRFKLALRDLGANTLPQRVSSDLLVPAVFRFSLASRLQFSIANADTGLASSPSFYPS